MRGHRHGSNHDGDVRGASHDAVEATLVPVGALGSDTNALLEWDLEVVEPLCVCVCVCV